MWSTASEQVRAVLATAARTGLSGPSSEPCVIGPDIAGEVVAEARFDRIAGFVVAAIDEGTVVAPEDVYDELWVVWRRSLVGAVKVEALIARVAPVLDEAGVRWRLTKGAAFAHLDYPDQVALRTFGDMDVMVHPQDWPQALGALGDVGFRRPAPELRPGFDVRFGKGATLVGPDELEVDLHLRFAIGRFGVRARMEELFERGDEIELAGRRIPCLAGPDRLLHACHHLALGGFSGARVARDVVQLLLVSEVDWGRTVATAERWKSSAVVARAVMTAWERLRLTRCQSVGEWACEYRPTAGDARAIDVFARQRPFRAQALTAVPVLGLRDAGRYLAALSNIRALRRRGSPGPGLGDRT